MKECYRDNSYELLGKLDMSQKSFAESLGISRQQFSNILAGGSNYLQKHLISIARKYNVNLNWLLCNQGGMFFGDAPILDETNLKGKKVSIPYWDGISADLIKKYGVDDLNVDLQIIINDWHANPENLIFIAMPGDDMDGFEYPLKNKDTLIVDTSRNNIAESGIYFCTTHGHTRVYVRRIIEKMTDEILCVTTVDNPRYKSIIEKKWTEEMWKAADVQVIGRVIKNMSYTI